MTTVRTTTTDTDMELEQLVPAPSALSLAAPDASVSVVAAVSANPAAQDEGGQRRPPAIPMRILERIPPESLKSVAQMAKLISELVKPVPWLGEAVELVASILVLCQNVAKNRRVSKRSAAELAEHCHSMLGAINGTLAQSSETVIQGPRKELISLLGRISAKLDEWTKWSFLRAFWKQETISETIKSFHAEIDQFCKRYNIITQTWVVNWLEVHEKRYEEDTIESRAFFAASENRQTLMLATGEETKGDVKEVLRILQRLLLQSNWHGEQRRALKENFGAMCNSSGQLPPDVELHEDFLKHDTFPVKGSGTFDIYRGSCLGYRHPCAIKVVRRMAYSAHTKRRFDRQFELWKAVHAEDKGRHILPLIGAVYQVQVTNPYLCFVSPWMEKGNALQYVKNNDHIDRIKLIQGIAEGLQILHTFNPPLLHGFLKSSNILIDDFGKPLLADFGLLRIIEREKFHESSCPDSVNAYRWLAPEMISAGKEPTAKSDIFMFAMTVLELMTEKKPFSHITRNPQVLSYRDAGGLPLRPEGKDDTIVRERGLDDRLWDLLNRCWKEPDERPSITGVLEELKTYPPPRA